MRPCSMTSLEPADRGRHDRHSAGHRLERGEAEALLQRRQQEQIGDREQRHDLILLAERFDAVARCRALAARSQRLAQIRAVADEQQPRRHRGRDAANTSTTASTRFTGPEVRHVDHQLSRDSSRQ